MYIIFFQLHTLLKRFASRSLAGYMLAAKASLRAGFFNAASLNFVILFFALTVFSNVGSIVSRSVAQCCSAQFNMDITRSEILAQL